MHWWYQGMSVLSKNNNVRENGLFPRISVLLDINFIEEDTSKITHAHLHGNKLFSNISFVLFQRTLFKLIILNSSSCYNDYITNVTVVFICILLGKANNSCEIALLPVEYFQTSRTKLFASNAQEYLHWPNVQEWIYENVWCFIWFTKVLVNSRFGIGPTSKLFHIPYWVGREIMIRNT